MSDLSDSMDAIGERLESVADAVEDMADTVVEEAQEQNMMTWTLWAALVAMAAWGLWQGAWRTAFVAAITLLLTLAPLVIQRWADFRLPRMLMFFIVLFALCTLVLGEVFDFYETFWWWDVALHSGSAVMFGLFGFILIMLVFKGAQLQASPMMTAMFAFTFAMAVGAVWEIFEFGMDQIFGLNMQKSGIVDTMWDLIVDAIGGLIGAGAGYVYLRRGRAGPVSGVIDDMVAENAHKFEGEADSPAADSISLAPTA